MKLPYQCHVAILLFAVFAEHLAAQSPGENLVNNGSFEAPRITSLHLPDESGFFATAVLGLGWTVTAVTGAKPLLEVQRSTRGWTAKDGLQYAELDGYNPVSISQDLPTRSGVVYTLEYWWSPRPGPYENQLKVVWNGVTIATHGASFAFETSLCCTNWRYEHFLVAASGDTTRIEFVETGPNDGRGVFLDAVSVKNWGREVAIKVQPERTPAVVHCRDDDEIITVAVIAGTDFDVRDIDRATVRFEGAKDIQYDDTAAKPFRQDAVPGDGQANQVFRFRLSSTSLRCDAKQGTLEGKTHSGVRFIAKARLQMVSK